MGLKIVISTSRFASEKQAAIDKLELIDMALSTIRNTKTHIEYIYDCEKESTIFGMCPKQDNINQNVIPQCDWFILLAPLQHVGAQTANELYAAYAASTQNQKPIISVFCCKNPLGKSTSEAYQEALKTSYCSKSSTDVNIDALLEVLQRKYGQQSKHYVVDYEYTTDHSSLKNKIGEQFDMLLIERKFKELQIDGMFIWGRNVSARALYYDKKRAQKKYGFNEQLYYPRQGVDDQIRQLINDGCRILTIIGSPGSGKTRCLYEYIHRTLSNERIILMHRNNVQDVIDRLKIDTTINMANFSASQEGAERGQRLYIITDQVRDVFEMGGVSDQDIKFFYKSILENRRYVFICTSISSAYDSFLGLHTSVKKLLEEKVELYNKLSILPIGEGQDDANFINWLKLHFKCHENGKTVADYIPNLNNYVEHIIKLLTDVENTKLRSYILCFLRSCQLINTFRHTSPLCLVIMLMRQAFENISKEEFKQDILHCINYLEKNNALWISGRLNSNSFNWEDDKGYDGEKMITIVPSSITFSFNELVWDALLSRDIKSGNSDHIFYQWNDPEEVKNAISGFYATFPTAKTLSRIIARIPHTDNYQECIDLCSEMAQKLASKFIQTDRNEITQVYNLLIGRAKSRRQVTRLIRGMKDLGLTVNETTIGEIIRFSKGSATPYTRDEIEAIQQEHQVEDSVYSISRKLEYFTKNFDEAMAFLNQDQVESLFNRVDTLKEVFTNDFFSLQRIYGTLAQRCNSKENIDMLTNYANRRYWAIISLADKENNLDSILDLLEDQVGSLYGIDVAQLDRIEDVKTAKMLLCGYIDKLSALTFSNVYSMVGNAFHNLPLLKLLQEYLEIGEGVWAPVKANYRERVYVWLIQKSDDFTSSLDFYRSWHNNSVQHNARMFAMCLNNCRRHEYKDAVMAFNRFETEMGGPEKVSLILYNQMLKISTSLDDASIFIRRMRYVDEYTLSNLLSIVDGIKSADQMPNSKRFVFAYELINHPSFIPFRCNIPVLGLLFKIASTQDHENYIHRMIKYDLDEEQAAEVEKLITSSKQITSILIRKNYHSINDAFALLQKNAAMSMHGEKSLPDCYSALCSKIGACKNKQERDDAFQRWDTCVEKVGCSLIKEEFFYTALYRFRKLDAIFDDSGEISEEFRHDMEIVKPTQSRTFANIMATLVSENFEFEKIWKFYKYYLSWLERNRQEKSLYPQHVMFSRLNAATRNNPERMRMVSIEQKRFKLDVSSVNPDNSLFFHKKIKTAPDFVAVLQLLEKEIDSGFLLTSVLNSALNGILLKSQGHRAEAYQSVMTFFKANPGLEKLFTAHTYASLIKLAPKFEDKKQWLYPEGEEPLSEILLGIVATEFIIAKNDINITRRYFDQWLSIYTDLGFALRENFRTLGTYLRIEIENAYDGYLQRVFRVIQIYVKNGVSIYADVFKKVAWEQVYSKLINTIPESMDTIQKVTIESDC